MTVHIPSNTANQHIATGTNALVALEEINRTCAQFIRFQDELVRGAFYILMTLYFRYCAVKLSSAFHSFSRAHESPLRRKGEQLLEAILRASFTVKSSMSSVFPFIPIIDY